MKRHHNASRQGPDHREGEQVTFLEVKQHFGLGHVRVGSWVSREESLLAANLVFDALADLALILGLPPKALGLRESLNLAFGHGGREGVMAHYAPQERTLALAKNAGAGALAHEFWHAFDHFIAPKVFDIRAFDSRACDNGGRGHGPHFASGLWLRDVPILSHPLNERLSELFRITMLSEDNQQPSDFVNRAVQLDRGSGYCYFSRPSELMARAFEACIESCGSYERLDQDTGELCLLPLVNPYLVTGTQAKSGARRSGWGTMPDGAFPDESHRKLIHGALCCYFHPLGRALMSRQ
ncbi:CLCA_X family protein [Shewanella sedimentimangrovi]|uniref:Large polyvalent protein-associated domain-containing protein n=1 Tax=Shewanella sedimentimangrovi TaxID=2814293 RepID=A0ABX7R8G6_9GAMM|nr:CLCA_X family protein [Shewanella sedimentimangrovi]QSX39066.1 hypothetical protein JYB85_09985 [Shewanella sedimentimangrovi]